MSSPVVVVLLCDLPRKIARSPALFCSVPFKEICISRSHFCPVRIPVPPCGCNPHEEFLWRTLLYVPPREEGKCRVDPDVCAWLGFVIPQCLACSGVAAGWLGTVVRCERGPCVGGNRSPDAVGPRAHVQGDPSPYGQFRWSRDWSWPAAMAEEEVIEVPLHAILFCLRRGCGLRWSSASGTGFPAAPHFCPLLALLGVACVLCSLLRLLVLAFLARWPLLGCLLVPVSGQGVTVEEVPPIGGGGGC